MGLPFWSLTVIEIGEPSGFSKAPNWYAVMCPSLMVPTPMVLLASGLPMGAFSSTTAGKFPVKPLAL